MPRVRLLTELLPLGSTRGELARKIFPSANRRRTRQLRKRLRQWANGHQDATVVQIGSHDGRTGDPLAELIDSHPDWRVVFVEPMPVQFAALKAHRGGQERFTLVQAAVTDHDGEVTMTTLDATGLMPKWADQLTSIDRKTVLKHKNDVPGLEAAIREVTVPAISFATLIKSAPFQRIDLLHIDAEGHDAVILDQVNLEQAPPDVVLFESKHLHPDDRHRCESRLTDAGYRLFADRSDTLALRPT